MSNSITIRATVNGRECECPARQTLSALLISLHLEAARVAIEYNRRIIKPAEWASTEIDNGAEIEIVHFVGGGSV